MSSLTNNLEVAILCKRVVYHVDTKNNQEKSLTPIWTTLLQPVVLFSPPTSSGVHGTQSPSHAVWKDPQVQGNVPWSRDRTFSEPTSGRITTEHRRIAGESTYHSSGKRWEAPS